MDTQQWFAVKTKPRRELQAWRVLVQRGIEAYLPRVPARRRPARSEQLEPLFPGYLFSRLAVRSPEWISARSAPNVAYFLGAPGGPVALPDELVAGIRARTETCQRQGWRCAFEPGASVIIDGGPFDGLEAIFDTALSPNGRVRVFLELVSRTVPVELDAASIRTRPRRVLAGA